MDLIVIAFGGNALLRPEDHGTAEEQWGRARDAARMLHMHRRPDQRLLLVHGNGPQVGMEMLRSEEASTKVPGFPLDLAVASTQGTVGYLLEAALRESFRAAGEEGGIATVLSLVGVNPDDDAFRKPTKPIGPYYTRYRASRLRRERGWTLVEDAGRGFRQVVPSPYPQTVANLDVLTQLLKTIPVVIAGGGGGVPVIMEEDGSIRGVEAVIDKDHTAALLGQHLGARLLVFLTQTACVYEHFGSPNQERISHLYLREAEQSLELGAFPPGSMGPKIAAACAFVRATGGEALITSVECLTDALAGKNGTRISP